MRSCPPITYLMQMMDHEDAIKNGHSPPRSDMSIPETKLNKRVANGTPDGTI